MAASAVGYHTQIPVLLTAQGSLSPEAAAAITNLGITQVIVMGGPIAISNSVVTSLQGMGVSVMRIAGQDYTDTAQLLAQFELNTTNSAGAANGLSWHPAGQVNLVRGDFYADGLAGGPLAGHNTQPILEAFNTNSLGGSTVSFLNSIGSDSGVGAGGVKATAIQTLGGPLAIAPATNAAAMQALAQG